MIEILPESQANLVAVQASESLSTEDYSQIWIPKLINAIDTHGKIRALIVFDASFQGWQAGAIWEDARFGFQHANDFEKIALVGASHWIEAVSRLFGHLMEGSVKTFTAEQRAQAFAWVSA